MTLQPSAFPATGETLAETAAARNARGEVLTSLRRLPSGRLFANVEEVWEALGGDHEGHHT